MAETLLYAAVVIGARVLIAVAVYLAVVIALRWAWGKTHG